MFPWEEAVEENNVRNITSLLQVDISMCLERMTH